MELRTESHSEGHRSFSTVHVVCGTSQRATTPQGQQLTTLISERCSAPQKVKGIH